MTEWGRGEVETQFLNVSNGRRPQNASATHQPLAHNLLTGLDGQEVVEFVQQLQQGRLLLGLTELRAQDKRSARPVGKGKGVGRLSGFTSSATPSSTKWLGTPPTLKK